MYKGYSDKITNNKGVPYIEYMREKIQKHTHPQNHKLSRLFHKKGSRQVSRIRGNSAQLVLDILHDYEETPSLRIKTNDFIISLIAEHNEYARLEEIYTIAKIKKAIRNVTDRKWAQEKIKALEIEYAWYRERMNQRLIYILNLDSDDITPNSTKIDSAPELESPHTDIQLSEQYTGWIVLLHELIRKKRQGFSMTICKMIPHTQK